MFALFSRILKLSGRYKSRIQGAFVCAFLESILSKMPIFLAFVVLSGFANKTITGQTCLYVGLGLAAIVLVQMLVHYLSDIMGKPDATEEEVYEAARKARCYDFIMALPDGFQTVVGEGGATLSGGEKQRISIARCILKDAPIVILDEATASVDTDNESYIQEAISELVKGKTLLVIAHRLNTIQNADQILVIDNGQIAQQGTHEELLKQPGIYQDFVNIRKSAAGWSLA